MTTKSIGKVKITTDKKSGKTKLSRVHSYDASKRRKIAKGKSKRVASRAKAASVPKKRETVSFQHTDLTGRKPKIVKATRAA